MAGDVAFGTTPGEASSVSGKLGVYIVGFFETVRKARGYLSLNRESHEVRERGASNRKERICRDHQGEKLMRRTWWLALVVWLLWRASLTATPALQLVPEEADFAVAVTRPVAVADTLLALATSERLQQFPAYQEAIGQVNIRRFLQLVRYAERELGKPWRELLDSLAGEGIVLAGKYAPEPVPVLVVVKGRDAALLERAVRLFGEVIEQELARRDLPHQRQKHERAGLKITQLGNAYYTVHGPALLVSNRLEVFDYVAPLLQGKAERSLAHAGKWRAAQASIPADAVAWAWADLRPTKLLPQVRQAVELPGDVPIVHVFFGRYLDLFWRAEYVSAWLTLGQQGAQLSVYVPAGWKGSALSARAQTPATGGTRLPPPLTVPGTIYTSSFYFDPASFLHHREKLLRPDQLKAFEELDRNSAKFLLGSRLSELVAGLGQYHRLIVAQPDRQTYAFRPGTAIPSFAVVLQLKEPEKIGPKLEAILRGAALLATFQTRLELVEEKHGDVKLVGYRFADNDANRAVQNGLLFNFSPCFAQVGDQFMLCSTLELGRQIVRALQKEKASPGGSAGLVFSDVFSWEGIVDLLRAADDELLVQFMLERVQALESARTQVKHLLELVATLGRIEAHLQMAEEKSQLDLRWQLAPERR